MFSRREKSEGLHALVPYDESAARELEKENSESKNKIHEEERGRELVWHLLRVSLFAFEPREVFQEAFTHVHATLATSMAFLNFCLVP